MLPPAECSRSGSELEGAARAGTWWSQVRDVRITTLVTEYLLPLLACPCCGKVNAAQAPRWAHPGRVSYGPGINTAAVALDEQLLAKLRERYDEAVAFGITHNRHRDWHDGNHPGYTLGCWLRDYKEQVWRKAGRPAGVLNAMSQGRDGRRAASDASRASRYRLAKATSHRSTHSGSAKPPRLISAATAVVVRW